LSKATPFLMNDEKKPQIESWCIALNVTCQTSTGQTVWQVVRRDGDQVDGKWMGSGWSTRDFYGTP
jgi:hypothetical protein